jgi:O-antigen ligase
MNNNLALENSGKLNRLALIIFPLVLAGMYVIYRRMGVSSIFVSKVAEPVVGILLAILIFNNPFWGIVLVVASVPIASSLPDVPSLSSIPVLIGGLTAASYFVRRFVMRRRGLQVSTIQLVIYSLMGLLALLYIVGQRLHPLPVQVINYSQTSILLFGLVLLAEQLIQSEKIINILMLAFIASVQVSAIAGIYQSMSSGVTDVTGVYVYRPGGLIGNANELGMYLSIAIIMAFYFIQTSRNRLILIFSAASLFISVVALVFTGSRGAVLFLIPAFIYQVVRDGKRSVMLLVLAAFILAMFAGFIPSGYWQRIEDIPSIILSQGDTVGLRYDFWSLALKMWQTSPIFGIGPGNFRYATGEFDYSSSNVSQDVVAHNMYVTLLTEEGLVGLAFFIAIFVIAIVLLLLLDFNRQSKMKGRWKKIVIVWECILAIGLLNGYKAEFGQNKIIWLCAGIALALFSINSRLQILPKPAVSDQTVSLQSKGT